MTSRRHVPVVFDDPNKFSRESFFDENEVFKATPDNGKVSNPAREFLLDTARELQRDDGAYGYLAWALTLLRAGAGDPDVKEKCLKGMKVGDKTFKVHLEPHGEWTTEIEVAATVSRVGTKAKRPALVESRGRKNLEGSLERWVGQAPRLECDWEPLRVTYRRSLVDLAALRFSSPITPGKSLPAAGLPWFMTMFGRDSIFTSLQALPFAPKLAAATEKFRSVVIDPFQANGRITKSGDIVKALTLADAAIFGGIFAGGYDFFSYGEDTGFGGN